MAKKKKKKKVWRAPKEWDIPEPRPFEKIKKPSRGNALADLISDHMQKVIIKLSREQGRALNDKEQNIIIQSIAEAGANLYTMYNETLFKTFETYPHPDVLEKTDRIDIRGMTPQEIADTIESNNFYNYIGDIQNLLLGIIPCYKTGVVYKTDTHRIFFDVKDVNMEENTFSVYLREYFYMTEQWYPGCGGLVSFSRESADKDNPHKINMYRDRYELIFSDVEDFPQMYTKLSPKNLDWTKEQCKLWHDCIIQNAVDQIAIAKHVGEDSHMENLADVFQATMLTVNFLLSEHRPVIERKPKLKETSNRTNELRPVDPDAPRVRTLGLVRFVSPKPPARMNEKVARSYTMKEWSVSGYIRHYKNGKVAYVKPSVHKRRKGLVKATEEQTPKQKITKLKNNLVKIGESQ